MTIDKNYFLSRLEKGENIDDIGQEVATFMNDAVEEFHAKSAAKDAEKRTLYNNIVSDVVRLAELEGIDPSLLNVSDKDIDQLVSSMTSVFQLIKSATAPSVQTSDDQILADFLKVFH